MRALRHAGPGPLRLDAFLRRELPGVPQSALHKWLRQNKIKVNGRKVPLSTRLEAGDEVALYLPEEALAPPPLQVLYEDDALLAAYKPAGLVSLTDDGGDSLLARARAHAGAAPGGEYPALCHRLDTGTSGVILLAKTPAMLEYVSGLLKAHKLQKTYYGLAVGAPAPAAGTLRGWLQKAGGGVKVLPAPAPGAREAITRYETLHTTGRLALLRLAPATGRTHQLRAQLAAAGTPLLGDSRYGVQKINREYRCRYQCLCAAEIAFPAEAPPDFAACAGLRIACPLPWFYTQALDGTLH